MCKVELCKVELRKVGNCLGSILPTDAVRAQQVREGDTLYLTGTRDGFRVTPFDPDFQRQMDAAEHVMHEFARRAAGAG